MNKIILAATLLALSAAVVAEDVKIGVILGFTGPSESLAQDMAAAAELVMSEASKSGHFLGGKTIVSIRADSTCIDAAAATAAAERLITADGVAAILGTDCPEVTTAIANNVSIPNGVVMVSPAAISAAIATSGSRGFFYRTLPSDARQGQILATVLQSRGIGEVAITYINNDYGRGLADAFAAAYEAVGGRVSGTVPHEDGKADYSAEVDRLSAYGSKYLAVFGYLDQGGKAIIQAAIDTDAFDNFVLADGMVGDSLIEAIGADLNGAIATIPGGAAGAEAFTAFASSMGVNSDGPFVAESFDAAALLVLAMQAAGSTDRAAIQSKMMMVANAPGKKVAPDNLNKALKIIAAGGDVDYQGATQVEFNAAGEAFGSYREVEVTNGIWRIIKVHRSGL